LIVLDPLFDPGHLDGSGLGKSPWVGFVGFSQIEVMGRLFNVEGDGVLGNIGCYTTSVPWVIRSVRENDI
jgi:hypothetical protein